MAESFGSQTATIPPGQSTYNSDVEAFHRLIKDECYDLEDYRNLKEFLNKATTTMAYFNCCRKFRYKRKKTPLKSLKETQKETKKPNLSVLKPIILDDHIRSMQGSFPLRIPCS